MPFVWTSLSTCWLCFFFSSRRRHTRCGRDWSSDVCSSDLIATGKLSPQTVSDIVEGVAEGCRENGCVLLGGETAEMPGFYGEGEYDVAGFIVGVVDRERVIDG